MCDRIHYNIKNKKLKKKKNESTCNVGDMGSVPGLGRSPGKGKDNSFQYSCLGSPWREEPGGLQSMGGHKELDTTEWLSNNSTRCPEFSVCAEFCKFLSSSSLSSYKAYFISSHLSQRWIFHYKNSLSRNSYYLLSTGSMTAWFGALCLPRRGRFDIWIDC